MELELVARQLSQHLNFNLEGIFFQDRLFFSATLIVQVVLKEAFCQSHWDRGCQADEQETDVIRPWLKQVAAKPGSSFAEGFNASAQLK